MGAQFHGNVRFLLVGFEAADVTVNLVLFKRRIQELVGLDIIVRVFLIRLVFVNFLGLLLLVVRRVIFSLTTQGRIILLQGPDHVLAPR